MHVASSLRTSVLALALVAMNAMADFAPSPPIQVSIHASWVAPPLLLEILEAVAVENKTAYFPLMRQLTGKDFLDSIASQKDLYQKSLDVIQEEGHVLPNALSTLKWSLAMHTSAPWIQAHYHLYNSTIVPDRIAKSNFDNTCGVWVDWYDRQICNISELEDIVAKGLDSYAKQSKSKPITMDLDHVQSSTQDPSLFAILYADVYDPEFSKFRQYLDTLAQDYGLQYSIRYRPSIKPSTETPLILSGYGVELALKNTDYIVIDDRDLGHSDDSNDSSGQTAFRSNSGKQLFGDKVPTVEPVREQDLGDMDVATAQFVLQSEDPLRTLVGIAQNFPKYQRDISQLTVNETFKQAFHSNAVSTRDDRARVWLNNQPVPHHKMNPFNLLRLIRRERNTLTSLATMGVSSKKAIDLLTDIEAADGENSAGADEPQGVFDVRDKSEDKDIIIWINDLGNDQRYRDWNSNLYYIMQPLYGSQFHQIRHNIINSLFVMDLSALKSLEVLSLELINWVQRLVPFRFGVLPLVRSDDGDDAKMAMLWRYVVNRHGIKGGLEFLKKTLINQVQSGQDFATASQNSFEATATLPKLKSTETPEMTYEEVIAPESSYRTWLKSVREMNDNIGVTAPALFINGKYFAWNEDHAQHLMTEVPQQYAFLSNRLRRGLIAPDINVYEYLLSLPSVHSRRNPYIFISDENPLRIVDLVQGQSHPFVDTLSYIQGDGTSQTVTILIAADFDTKSGLDIALSALNALDPEKDTVRVAFIQNGPLSPKEATLANFIRQSSVDGKSLPIGFWKDLLESVEGGASFIESFKRSTELHPEVGALIATEGGQGVEEESDKARVLFLRDTLQIQEGEIVFIVNGRVVGPIKDKFTSNDFELLVKYENVIRASKIKALLEKAQVSFSASTIMKASSVIFGATQQLDQGLYDINDPVIHRDRTFSLLNSELAGFVVDPTVQAGDDETLFHFTAVLNPATELTQRWAPLLETLSRMDNVKVEIVLMPALRLTQVPIKRFYRYVVEPELTFDVHGANIPPMAYFGDIPESTLLTLGVDVNPAWVVTSTVCIHDLDNLKLSSLTGSSRLTGVQAEFELEHILIEGYARDMTQKTPPKGAQFILGTKAQPHVTDTLVMANMGYFQLKAKPGVWEMVLRPGRTQQIFSIESIGSEGWVPGGVENDKRDVVIANFEGLVLYPRLVRNPGMERANIQDELVHEGSGIWNSIKSTIKGFTSSGAVVSTKKKAAINIFSVASGHLYERFLSIMILSVLKHTNSHVKFWFIENFLSPSFKDFLPYMAKKYDFDYELVTYNWPHWLRAQTEKQRIIWAYKILFLDVLFPLDLDKVIFVDADQIVRTDMKELVDLDLKGAPYGYTPMCQDRKEMEGFRFWNQGYWKEHLGSKPYHISALYVIDLVRFRQMQAGDRLRNHYQQLSRDPNSLANLDQDLPNNMQDEVPIFSLPQEWLWCETWCGDEGLAKAKTIDLCNNPLTKEPKLDRARRQIKEWESLDNEVTEFAKQVNAELKQTRRQYEQEKQKQETKGDSEHYQDPHAKKDEL